MGCGLGEDQHPFQAVGFHCRCNQGLFVIEGDNFAHQQSCGQETAIAGGDHPFALGDAGVFGEIFQAQDVAAVAAGDASFRGEVSLRFHQHRDAAVEITQQQHAAGGFADADDAPDKPVGVHDSLSVLDALVAARLQNHRAFKRACGFAQHAGGEEGGLRREGDLEQIFVAGEAMLHVQGAGAPLVQAGVFLAQAGVARRQGEMGFHSVLQGV